MITNCTQMAQKVEEIHEFMSFYRMFTKGRKMDGEFFLRSTNVMGSSGQYFLLCKK